MSHQIPNLQNQHFSDRSADVVVVGAGIAGLWTALHLAEAGIQTLLIHRNEGPSGQIAGSTRRSVGAISLRPLLSASFEDEMFKLGRGQENPTVARVMRSNLRGELERMKSFSSLDPIALGVKIGSGGTKRLVETLRSHLTERGVEILDGAVTRLHADVRQCSGVEYSTPEGSGRIFAPNIVMACGGFAGLFGRAPQSLTQGSLLGQYMACGGIIANPEFVFKHGFGTPDTSELTPTEALRGASIVDDHGNHLAWLEQLVFDGQATTAHQRAVQYWRENRSKNFYICYHHQKLSEACLRLNQVILSESRPDESAISAILQDVLHFVPASETLAWVEAILHRVEEGRPLDYATFSRLRSLSEPVSDTSQRKRVREMPYFTMGGAAHREFLTNLDGVFVNGEAMHDFGADRVGGLPWALYLSAAPEIARQVGQRLRRGVQPGAFEHTSSPAPADLDLLDRVRQKLADLQQDKGSRESAQEGMLWAQTERRRLGPIQQSSDEGSWWLLLAEAVFAASALRAESRGCFNRDDCGTESQALSQSYSLCRYSPINDSMACAFARRDVMNSITPEKRQTMSIRPLTENAVDYLLERHLREGRGEYKAVIEWEGEEYSYARLQQLTASIAQELLARDIQPGQRVALLMPDSAHLVASFLACLKLGCVAVPTNTFATGSDLLFLLEDMDARLVLCTSDLAPGLEAAAKKANFQLPPLIDPHSLSLEGFEALIETRCVASSDPAFWLYTSGTTGHPKGVVHSHGGLKACAQSYPQDVLGLSPSDLCFSTSKMFFAYGLGNSLIFPLACGAAMIVDSERGQPSRILRILEQLRPTKFFSIPTIYSRLAQLPQLNAEMLASVDLCVSAGEYLPPRVEKAWRQATSKQIYDGIGTTESLHIFCSNRRGEQRSGTSGKPVVGYELQIVGDDGEPTPPGCVGHLRVRGKSLAAGYHARPDATALAFEEDWLRTGDLFSVDSEGFYTYAGRSTDSFKSSGLWVSPAEIEQVLIGQLTVGEAAVIASADKSGLVGPKAFITMRPDSIPPLPQSELGDYLRECLKVQLPNFKVPHSIEVLQELPRTATGKVDRAALRRSA